MMQADNSPPQGSRWPQVDAQKLPLPTPPEAAMSEVSVWKVHKAQESMAYFCLQADEKLMAFDVLCCRFLTNSTFIIGKFLCKNPGCVFLFVCLF